VHRNTPVCVSTSTPRLMVFFCAPTVQSDRTFSSFEDPFQHLWSIKLVPLVSYVTGFSHLSCMRSNSGPTPLWVHFSTAHIVFRHWRVYSFSPVTGISPSPLPTELMSVSPPLPLPPVLGFHFISSVLRKSAYQGMTLAHLGYPRLQIPGRSLFRLPLFLTVDPKRHVWGSWLIHFVSQ